MSGGCNQRRRGYLLRVPARPIPDGRNREQLLASRGLRMVFLGFRDPFLHQREKKTLLEAFFESFFRGAPVPAIVHHERDRVSR